MTIYPRLVVMVLSLSMVCQAALAQEAVDTASGNHADPFVRYTTPGQCKQAAIRLRREYWRDKRRDLLVYAPEMDSVPVPVLQMIRQCAARFDVATVRTRELLDLAQLYIWVNEDDLARQASDRLLHVMVSQPPAARGWVLWLLSNSLLHAYPARIAAARAYLSQLDALGAPAALWRLFAHTAFAEYANSVDDRRLADAEARAALAASHQMAVTDRIDWVYSIIGAYTTLTVPVSLTRGGAAALTMLDTALADVMPLRPAGSREQQDLHRNILNARIPLAALGTHGLPSVHAAAWYGAGGDTIRPRRGKATLLLFVNTTCSGGCYPTFAVLRRLHDKYGAQLDLVLMTSTVGYFRNQPMPSPAVEADSAGSYYTQFIGLPAAVAVETTSFGYIPDGRRRNEPTPNHRVYGAFGKAAILVDGDGIIRWLGNVDPINEAVLNAVLQAAIKST